MDVVGLQVRMVGEKDFSPLGPLFSRLALSFVHLVSLFLFYILSKEGKRCEERMVYIFLAPIDEEKKSVATVACVIINDDVAL